MSSIGMAWSGDRASVSRLSHLDHYYSSNDYAPMCPSTSGSVKQSIERVPASAFPMFDILLGSSNALPPQWEEVTGVSMDGMSSSRETDPHLCIDATLQKLQVTLQISLHHPSVYIPFLQSIFPPSNLPGIVQEGRI